MDLPRKNNPVWDKCIYCGELPLPGQDLTSEHIIPQAFGGRWELLGASCQNCARITSTFEKDAADHLVTPIREHLGLLGRKQRRPRLQMPVNLVKGSQQSRIKVDASIHPAVMYMYAFASPTLFTGEPLQEDITGRLAISELTDDFAARAGQLPGQVNLVMRGPYDPLPLVRTLAKIAHAYAMAKLGSSGFRPFLTSLILGRTPSYPNHFVGSAPKPTPKWIDRHHVSMDDVARIDGRKFLVVTIRLFGDVGMPVHEVVVGERPDADPPYSPTQPRPISLIRVQGTLIDGFIVSDDPGRVVQPAPIVASRWEIKKATSGP